MENSYTYFKEFTIPKLPDKKFIIRSTKESDFNEILELIENIQLETHPVTVNLSISREEVKFYMGIRVKNGIDQDLSVVIVDSDTEKIVGCFNANDMAKPPNTQLERIFRKKALLKS